MPSLSPLPENESNDVETVICSLRSVTSSRSLPVASSVAIPDGIEVRPGTAQESPDSIPTAQATPASAGRRLVAVASPAVTETSNTRRPAYRGARPLISVVIPIVFIVFILIYAAIKDGDSNKSPAPTPLCQRTSFPTPAPAPVCNYTYEESVLEVPEGSGGVDYIALDSPPACSSYCQSYDAYAYYPYGVLLHP